MTTGDKTVFTLNVLAAIFAIVLTGLNMAEGDYFLTACWGICAACNIYFAWRNKDYDC